MAMRSLLIHGLVAVVLLGMGVTALAFDGGDGSAQAPYRISTANQLRSIGSNPTLLDKHFVLTADVDMAGRIFTTAVVAPRGSAFTGVFDGAGHKIMNLTIDTMADSDPNNDENSRLALFGTIEEAGRVRNLGVLQATIKGGRGSILGPLCGLNRGRISRCYATGQVSSGNASYHLGGLCGANQFGVIEQCWADTDVSGARDSNIMGGLCGLNESGRIIDCYARGDVVAGDHVSYLGGLCGLNRRLEPGSAEAAITRCYSTGRVIAGDGPVLIGGLCGNSGFDGTVDASFWDTETSGMATSHGGTGLPTAQMKTRSTFVDAGWDFINTHDDGTQDTWWLCVDGVEYPQFAWQPSPGDMIEPSGVDLLDLLTLAAEWTSSSPVAGDIAPARGDGGVDLLDYAVLSAHWLCFKPPLLAEDFDDGDLVGWTIMDQGTAGDPSSNWSAASGTLMQSNRIYSPPGNSAALLKLGTFALYDGGYTWADYTLSCVLRSDWINDFGVMFRVQDENNYYRFSWRNATDYSFTPPYLPYTRIVKVVDGQATLLAEVQGFSFELGESYDVTIQVIGPDIALYVDDNLILEAQDTSFATGTIGLYCYGNRYGNASFFDDVLVSIIESRQDRAEIPH